MLFCYIVRAKKLVSALIRIKFDYMEIQYNHLKLKQTHLFHTAPEHKTL